MNPASPAMVAKTRSELAGSVAGELNNHRGNGRLASGGVVDGEVLPGQWDTRWSAWSGVGVAWHAALRRPVRR